ncbi:hypothetical protein U9M48_024678 [Paspalum notatum var. saurae]|uniref:Knottins-like domain-containing protein n=1 Tax=Paspalum notatum var. saurae TaxID=547442 RepID=A0AAQ3TMS6_PASNO
MQCKLCLSKIYRAAIFLHSKIKHFWLILALFIAPSGIRCPPIGQFHARAPGLPILKLLLLWFDRCSVREMAWPRGMTVPILLVLFLIALETVTARDVVEERLCLSQSHTFKGMCISSNNCANVCMTENFTSGVCKIEGATRKCFCKKIC